MPGRALPGPARGGRGAGMQPTRRRAAAAHSRGGARRAADARGVLRPLARAQRAGRHPAVGGTAGEGSVISSTPDSSQIVGATLGSWERFGKQAERPRPGSLGVDSGPRHRVSVQTCIVYHKLMFVLRNL